MLLPLVPILLIRYMRQAEGVLVAIAGLLFVTVVVGGTVLTDPQFRKSPDWSFILSVGFLTAMALIALWTSLN